MKLAHLSDLHLGRPPKELQLRRVLNLVDLVIDSGVDHLLLGGDLVDSGDLGDALPLVRLLKRRKFFSAERLSVVPGNHDIWPFSETDLLGTGLAALLADAKRLVTFRDWPAQENYERFTELFRATFKGTVRLSDEDPYPCLKRLDGLTVAMLDTTSDAGYLRSARGRFDTSEGRFLSRELKGSAKPAILLMHHPPHRVGRVDLSDVLARMPGPVTNLVDMLGLEERHLLDFERVRPVQRFIKGSGVDAVLYGHLHEEPSRSPRRLGGVATYC